MLSLLDVSAGYGATTVLRNITIDVPASSVVALLGPNGAGKTTLLRAASGLNALKGGKVVLGDKDVSRTRAYGRARLGLCHIPEGRGIYPSLTVKENITLYAHKGQESSALERVTDVFPALKGRADQLAGELSGGQQQMLSFARAYLQDPSIVLVDEASTGLAPVIVDEIFEFLTNIRKTGTALLIVEQYVSRALAIADHVYLLNKGEIVFSGKPSEIQGDVYAHYLGNTAEHTS